MTKLFISYRRADSQHAVDRLYEALRKHLPKKDIFIDVDNIPKGVDFADHLARHVGQCETLLAIVGPQWLSLADETGRRRLDSPDDFVRIEIAAALKRNIPVVPVLLDGTPMPRADQLPADLKGFERRNAAFLSRDSFRSDMDKLIEDLGLKPKLAWQVPAIGAGIALAAGLGALFVTGTLNFPSAAPAENTLIEAAAETTGDELAGIAPADTSTETDLPSAANTDSASSATETAPAATLAAHKTYLADPANVRYRADAEAAVARHEAAVLRLQTALAAKGFAPGNVDGRAGSSTARAIEQFRAAAGYSAPSVDLTAIDAAPIAALAASVEAWTRPATTPSRTASEPAPVRPEPTRASQRTAGEVFSDCTGCPSMVGVPAGSFMMGSPSTETRRAAEEGPQRTVTIGSDFAVGRYEVTWAEWDACVADEGCSSAGPDGAGGDEGWGKGKRPVINVSWDDAQAYVSWLSRKTGKTYRLLSEAEWEYAARAGTTTPFSFGSTISTSQANYDGNYTYGSGVKGEYRQKTTPAGSFSANSFGLYDMHGNVWEWTQDCWNDSYSGAPKNGSVWTSGDCSRRVVRGGSWVKRSAAPPLGQPLQGRHIGPGQRRRVPCGQDALTSCSFYGEAAPAAQLFTGEAGRDFFELTERDSWQS